MSTKKIAAGDTLTVGDLTDDHLGAVIEVDDGDGTVMRFALSGRSPFANGYELYPLGSSPWFFEKSAPVKVIAPPPVVQPDEPTILGQCIRIEESRELRGVVADPGTPLPIRTVDHGWMDWEEFLGRAGNRQIIVSDPPRWPDETPEVPERIEVGEWPGDVSLRAYRWVDREGDSWTWRDREYGGLGWGITSISSYESPLAGPWTRGERVK